MKILIQLVLALFALMFLSGCSMTHEFGKYEFTAPGYLHTISAEEGIITAKMEADPAKMANAVVDGVSSVVGNIIGKFDGLFGLLQPAKKEDVDVPPGG